MWRGMAVPAMLSFTMLILFADQDCAHYSFIQPMITT
jgi:hypothetical protein